MIELLPLALVCLLACFLGERCAPWKDRSPGPGRATGPLRRRSRREALTLVVVVTLPYAAAATALRLALSGTAAWSLDDLGRDVVVPLSVGIGYVLSHWMRRPPVGSSH